MNELYLLKESEMLKIKLSLVNLSALLCLYSEPHFHSLSTNPIPPCHFTSALENLHFVILETTKGCSLAFCKTGFSILEK